ncbi:hypothetical protein GCM10019016_029680 [Streptomyces prasinosporus]|uniref:Uncharacterized protein n=1 Tax=Streptomyces prasinosporus TaxID=68256 RepID=A0ABP6TN22_9ACTN
MTRGGAGNAPGVGGARRHLDRETLRGTGRTGRVGGGEDPRARKRELLRGLREQRRGRPRGQRGEGGDGREAPLG